MSSASARVFLRSRESERPGASERRVLAEGVVSAGPPGKRLLSNLPGGGETRVLQRELLRLMMRTALICGGGGRSQESNTILIKGFYVESLCLLVRKSHVYQEKRR